MTSVPNRTKTKRSPCGAHLMNTFPPCFISAIIRVTTTYLDSVLPKGSSRSMTVGVSPRCYFFLTRSARQPTPHPSTCTSAALPPASLTCISRSITGQHVAKTGHFSLVTPWPCRRVCRASRSPSASSSVCFSCHPPPAPRPASYGQVRCDALRRGSLCTIYAFSFTNTLQDALFYAITYFL